MVPPGPILSGNGNGVDRIRDVPANAYQILKFKVKKKTRPANRGTGRVLAHLC